MSYVSFDISSLFKRVFDVDIRRTPVFGTAGSQEEKRLGDVSFPLAFAEKEEAEVMSYVGTPVRFPIEFVGGVYNVLNKGVLAEVSVNDYQLPHSTLVDFRRSKSVAMTPINGGSGTVKEMYSFEDWQVKIYGFIIPDKEDVETQLSRLLQFENIADSIEVSGYFFEKLGIDNLVILDIDLPQVKGKPDYRPFVLNCISDEPVELIL